MAPPMASYGYTYHNVCDEMATPSKAPPPTDITIAALRAVIDLPVCVIKQRLKKLITNRFLF